ncbi:hypothetical protein TIFTF001_017393 [Ficus carica]|uniref:Uncharacterized protein n=1 Tax=Ficus carica TaxID=3494 RepID=A0AA88A9F5_FICCA|nr:hypothetical protein TIFTF001_017393 [Ficus carica]
MMQIFNILKSVKLVDGLVINRYLYNTNIDTSLPFPRKMGVKFAYSRHHCVGWMSAKLPLVMLSDDGMNEIFIPHGRGAVTGRGVLGFPANLLVCKLLSARHYWSSGLSGWLLARCGWGSALVAGSAQWLKRWNRLAASFLGVADELVWRLDWLVSWRCQLLD